MIVSAASGASWQRRREHWKNKRKGKGDVGMREMMGMGDGDDWKRIILSTAPFPTPIPIISLIPTSPLRLPLPKGSVSSAKIE
jgi:hypothetical protein